MFSSALRRLRVPAQRQLIAAVARSGAPAGRYYGVLQDFKDTVKSGMNLSGSKGPSVKRDSVREGRNE